MRRVLLSTVSTIAGIILLLSLKPHHEPPSGSASLGTEPAAGSPGTSAGPPTPQGVSSTRSGTFTGDVIDTRYGPVQVAVTLVDGRITDVRVLRTPDDNGRDRQIAARSVPTLTREALAAQSARIHTVSGATYTSKGYMQSLQSALDQAHG
ncbi:FMN-binding protein [Embleya sp. NPDC020630]|uniref:FMN-binding protein n=1 Tax=Embleya sp. NPDC020630 TaxID=3363979 RepID=UPI00379EE3E1